MTAQAHHAAIVALIGSAVRLYDEGHVPDTPTLPYAVLFMGAGDRERTRMASVSDKRNVEFQVTSVGLDGDGMRSVQDRVSAALLDRRPSVAGHATSPIWQPTGASDVPRIDRDVTPHRLYAADVFAFASTPS